MTMKKETSEKGVDLYFKDPSALPKPVVTKSIQREGGQINLHGAGKKDRTYGKLHCDTKGL